MLKCCYAVYHELLHMASYDRDNDRLAFEKSHNCSLYEGALIEGMTEYLSTTITGYPPIDYHFEVFVASMIAAYDRVVESFFTANHNNFINSFSNQKDIYSLMYSLDFYSRKRAILKRNKNIKLSKIDKYESVDSVYNVIDSLINIELSTDKNMNYRRLYADKFMDLISEEEIKTCMDGICKSYRDYAYYEVKRRVLGRK